MSSDSNSYSSEVSIALWIGLVALAVLGFLFFISIAFWIWVIIVVVAVFGCCIHTWKCYRKVIKDCWRKCWSRVLWRCRKQFTEEQSEHVRENNRDLESGYGSIGNSALKGRNSALKGRNGTQKGPIQCVAIGDAAIDCFNDYRRTFLKDWDIQWYKPEKLMEKHGKFLLIVSTKSGRIGEAMEEVEEEWSNNPYLDDGKEWMIVVVSSCLKSEENNPSDIIHKQHKPSFARDLSNIIFDEQSRFNRCLRNEISCAEIQSFLSVRLDTTQS